MKNKKSPFSELNLTPDQWEELLKDIKIEDLLPPEKIKTSKMLSGCSLCRGTKKVLVCGGPNRTCPACAPKF